MKKQLLKLVSFLFLFTFVATNYLLSETILISDKIKIIEALWSIIYSNKDADIYETNLMRRLAGLLYIDNKVMGDIKDKIKKESS